MAYPVVRTNPQRKDTNMRKIPRVRECTATSEELAEDARRCRVAKTRIFSTVETFCGAHQPRENTAELRATHGKNGRPELPAVRR
jgi:hypothetical protein